MYVVRVQISFHYKFEFLYCSSRVSSTVPVFNFVPTDEENLPCNKYGMYSSNKID